MKKIILIIICSSFMMASIVIVYADQYSDVGDKHWASPAINTASEKGIINGYPDGTFKANEPVTYGEFIKMVYLAAGNKALGNSEDGNWAMGYYKEALKLGYFEVDDISFDELNDLIPRDHMALLTSNVYGDVIINGYEYIENDFEDIAAVAQYKKDIIKIYAVGITKGYYDKIYGKKTFQPDKTLTRAEAAQIIYKLTDQTQCFPQGSMETITTKTSDSDIVTKKVTVTITLVPMGTTPPATGGSTVELKDYWSNGIIVTDSAISYDVKLGDYGIQKFETLKKGSIQVYSTVCYSGIVMYVDGIRLNGACFPDGEYYMDNGYYVYCVYFPVGNDKNVPVTVHGKVPSLILYKTYYDENNPVYRYTDVTLSN